jgi:phosphatidylserine/phosphatidylglycerophosphate/cardiolipin synthase-like enzyme
MKKISFFSIFILTLFFSSRAFCQPANLTLFVEPDDGKQILLNAINRATKQIDLEIYMLTDNDLIKALETRADAGIPTRVILQQHLWPNLVSPYATKAELEKHGVKVHWGNPKFSYTHEKCLITDNSTAYIMTLNWSATTFAINREYGLVDIIQKDINEIETVFQADWNLDNTPLPLSDKNLLWSPNNARDKMTSLLNTAKNTLYIESEIFDDAKMQQTLMQIAKKSVDVRLIVSFPSAEQKTILQQLAASGVQVRILDCHHLKTSNLYMHAKLALLEVPHLDEINLSQESVSKEASAYVGSINYLTQSLDQNRELGITLSAKDSDSQTIITKLATVFQRDWNTATPLADI